MSTREVVVISGVRTAIGDYGGSLKELAATKLGAIAIKEAVARSKVAPESVGHVVIGGVIHGEAKDMYLSRVAAVEAGIPVGTPSRRRFPGCRTYPRLRDHLALRQPQRHAEGDRRAQPQSAHTKITVARMERVPLQRHRAGGAHNQGILHFCRQCLQTIVSFHACRMLVTAILGLDAGPTVLWLKVERSVFLHPRRGSAPV